MSANPENIGKYYRWESGIRCKATGIDEYGWYKCCVPNDENQIFLVSTKTMEEAEEISELDAKAQFIEIKHNTPQVPFCDCGMWRVGRPNLSLKMALKQGRLSFDESNRIQKELETFFNDLKVIVKVYNTDDGVHFEFFNMSENQNESKES